jgi:hypothetical protein
MWPPPRGGELLHQGVVKRGQAGQQEQGPLNFVSHVWGSPQIGIASRPPSHASKLCSLHFGPAPTHGPFPQELRLGRGLAH